MKALIKLLQRWYLSTKALQERITDLRVEVRELKLANGRQLQRIKALQSENINLAHQLDELQDTGFIFPPDITFEPWGLIDEATVDWCKYAISQTGMGYVLVEGNISEIRIGPDEKTDMMTGVLALATVSNGIIYLDDKGWMPGWDLPGTIIHEAVHNWQALEGLTNKPSARELQAYSVQQLFEWRYCGLNGKTPRNLFKERLGAIGLL